MLVKICGLSTQHSLAAALKAGADMIGLVFHPKSPRFVGLQTAADLADEARGRATVVALVCDFDDKKLRSIQEMVMPDLWQLHGQESPSRANEIAKRFEIPVMKALGVATAADLDAAKPFHAAGHRLLLDAKAPRDAKYPGGHGAVFDWSLLKGLDPKLPFMLSGGLEPENVGRAIAEIRALGRNLLGVDVSSGVERAPGQKSIEKIEKFVKAVRKA